MILTNTTKPLSVIADHKRESFKRDQKTFDARFWNHESTRQWLNKCTALNVAPCTLHGLDKLGLNTLEIIHFSGLIGKKIHGLPSADIDFLNELEERFNIVFGYEQKIKNQYLKAKVDHFCGSFNAEGNPLFVTALFTLADLYS